MFILVKTGANSRFMIKAVIFDCFGVLTKDNWLAFRAKHFEHNKELWATVTEINKKYDSGGMHFKEFVYKISSIAGVDPEKSYLELTDTPPNLELFEYIKLYLKPKYKIGLLSNVGDNWLTDIFTTDQNSVFDEVALSYEIGHSKPEKGAYQAIIDRLGVKPDEAIFIDDQPKYVSGAKHFGIKSVHFKNTQQAIYDLELLLK